jgi:predicted transposase YbfD/YdcC
MARETYSSSENHRNRIETRNITVYTNKNEFIADTKWASYVETVICVRRDICVLNTKTKRYQDRSETSIHVANFDVNAQDAGKMIRNHWGIENKNHHVRDVSLKEDESRIRINPENMSTIRSFALNVLRNNKVKNIKGELYCNSIDYYNLYSYQQFI